MAKIAISSVNPPEWAIRKRKTLAPAIVLKWNDTRAYVVCPFPTCQKLHSHGSSRAPEGYPTCRLSHCDKLQQEYQLVWPFETDGIARDLGLGFKLDRDTGIWRTIGSDNEDPETEEILRESAKGAIQGHPSEEDLLESLDHLALDDEQYVWFISHCVNGDIQEAALCLTSTNLAETYLQRKNSDGNTALALACMEGHYDMVALLAERGSPINSKNNECETPLIISLQHDRTEVATYLVSHNASISDHDRSGASVLSHAKELLERLEEIRVYCHTPSFSNSSAPAETKVLTNTDGKGVLKYREDWNPSISMRYQEHQKKIDRVQIIINACIVNEATQKRIRKYKQNRARKVGATKVSISCSADQAMVTVFRDAYQIPMADGGKTFGYLELGEAHDLVFAVSGWSGRQCADTDGCVDRGLWTKRVFEFSSIIGHSNERHECDRHGQEGVFHACHAEKQLMAFTLWHYTSLQEKPAQQASEAEWARYEKMSELHQCVRNSIRSTATCTKHCQSYHGPPVEAIKPTIYVTRTVCADCTRFRRRILEYSGIDITLKVTG
jgi:ankyrin repeat protein